MSFVFEPQFGMVCASLPHLERTLEYGLTRVELVLIAPDDRPAVRDLIAASNLQVGFHAPAFRRDDLSFRPLLCALVDPDARRREESLGLWEDNLRLAAQWGARYLVAHTQRPMQLLGEEPPTGFGEAEALAIAIEMGERLSALSRQYETPVFIENSISNPVFYRPEAFVALFEQVPELRMCLDIGHLFLDAYKYDFDPIEFARIVAPFVASFHVYGNTISEDFEFSQLPEKKALRKHPPHPSQLADEGWMDNASILRTVLAIQPEALVNFEIHYQMDVDRHITYEGLQWVRKVCLETQIGL